MTPAGLATALGEIESVKNAALGAAKPRQGFKDAPGAFHAESNDQWPEDDY